jgi:DNA-binding MarR family transcriptional regulator
MQESFEHLKLENQFCFHLYAASRLITRSYQPILDELGLTYPQYLVLLVLWETDNLSVGAICQKLYLESNTLTPLLKRLEKMALITRVRSVEDERSVKINLTESGLTMKRLACNVPFKLTEGIDATNEEKRQVLATVQDLFETLKTAFSTNP